MRRSRILMVLALAVVAIVLAWKLLAPATLAVVQPSRGPAVEAVYATGLVEPTLEIRIAPRAAGRIVELLADEGDEVHKGQPLARIEDADLQSAAAELAARFDYAQSQYRRNLELRRSGVVSPDAVERSRTDLVAARAALKRAQDQLGYVHLVAPSDGRIIRRDGEVGEFIPVNQTVFYIAGTGAGAGTGPAPLRINADVDEEDVPRIALGLPVLIRADAFPDSSFRGHVDQITPRGDPVTRSYRVRVALDETTPLQIGMTAEANIVVVERKDALLLPSSAIADGRVWEVRDGRLFSREVTIGAVGSQRTEIRAGLAGGEWIVVQPPEDLSAGSRVRARKPAGPPAESSSASP